MSRTMSEAPLPLAGTFHEFSVAVDDVRGALEFYERLGFTQAPASDTWQHPYGVLTDGRLFLGLHRRGAPSPTLTFVRPGIAENLSEFTARGIELTRCHTGDEILSLFEGLHREGSTIVIVTHAPDVAERAARCITLHDGRVIADS